MTINFFGDIALHNINCKNFTFSEEIKKILAAGALNVGNFECPITESDDPSINHPVHLKCAADSLEIVEGFHAFSLANNHLLDFGTAGLMDTFRHLKERNFDFFGGGINQDEALKPLVKTFGKIKIALLGATRFSFSAKNKPGAAKDSLPRIKRTIKKLKKENCFVVVYFHWGFEYVPYPAPRERRMAHKCIDYGADLIVGAHPHIVQGIEKYRNKYIFYSLGNFIFDSKVFNGLSYYENDQRIFKSFVLRLDLNSNHEYNFQIHPYKISNLGVELLNETDKVEMLKEIDDVSSVFREGYFAYLKKYFRYAAGIAKQNRKVLVNYTLKKKWDLWNLIIIYSRANYQDVLNKIVGTIWR